MTLDDNINLINNLDTSIPTTAAVLDNTVIEELTYPNFSEIGYVTAVTDGIAYVHGLTNAFAGEVVQFNSAILGLVVNLEENITGVTIFGNDRDIRQGDYVERIYTMLEIPTGPLLLGRTVDALGNFIDNNDATDSSDDTTFDNSEDVETVVTDEGSLDLEETLNDIELRAVEIKAPGIISRMSVNEPILTGIIAIDSMIPIGRGQRELIIGDRQTGKTAIAVDTIINQHSNTFYI
jgi:F0F1-type ATP synthase alpha subunit